MTLAKASKLGRCSWGLVFVLVASLLALTCRWSEPTSNKVDGGASTVEKEQMCSQGQATYDRSKNECVCDADRAWRDNRCQLREETKAALTESISSCRASGGEWDETQKRCGCPQGQIWDKAACVASSNAHDEDSKACQTAQGTWQEHEKTCLCPEADQIWNDKTCVAKPLETADHLQRMREVCVAAKGQWLEEAGYCDCPDKKVLLGRSCHSFRGRLVDDLCKRAVFPGTWRDGRCLCGGGKVFSPGRGGCVAKFQGSPAVLQKICESSLNNGTWNDEQELCRCPSGRVWSQESCTAQGSMSSYDVCKSDFNKGTWDFDRKTCSCSFGRLWINQSCQSLQRVTAQQACLSERNAGTWDEKLKTCACPAPKTWMPIIKSCEVGGGSPEQQLCLHTGGVPGKYADQCHCGGKLFQQVVKSKSHNYQYCSKKRGERVPAWLLLLLDLRH